MSPSALGPEPAPAPLGDDAFGVLCETLARLWPQARVELVRSRRSDPAATVEFLVLPSARAPRMLLPAAPAAAAGAVRRFSATAGPGEIAARTAASGALRVGAARALPDRVRVYAEPGAPTPLVDHLGDALGTAPPTFSLTVGPARVNRKPVLQLFDTDGRSLGFAKLGDSPTAAEHVRAEADALEVLATRRFDTLRVPRLLHRGAWQGIDVLVQQDLGVRPGSALVRTPALAHRAEAELEAAFAEDPAPLASLAWWGRCHERAGAAAEPALAARFREAMELVAARYDAPVPVSAWHGDWTPWNMAPGRRDTAPGRRETAPGRRETAPGRGGTLLVWDWERFETGVPAGMDALHFAVNAATRRHGATADVVRNALLAAGTSASTRSSTGASTGAAYLVAITSRYLEMSGAPGGGLIVPRAVTALELVEEWARAR
ncbi:hypothetical protein [Nocardioides campestrisoli]|uniref:hypothetical protein n=1 Tax=Nocardioides campestrisoli TaxID=2736757 RepID=UPI0015E791E3|nr:hypothetical protein [Nocardioides campestrisoli]